MYRPNFDPQYQRILRARRTVAALMKRGESEKARYKPIFMRLQRELEAHGGDALDAMLQDALS